MENHVGICAACAGAIKQKSLAAYQSVRRSYCDLRSKASAQQPSSSYDTRTQRSEERALNEHTGSCTTPSLDGAIDNKEIDAGIRLEEVPMSALDMK